MERSRDVRDRLAALSHVPARLGQAADGAQVAAALRRAVPELVDGSWQLRAGRVDDLRLKRDGWVGRYVVTVADPTGTVRDLALTGLLAAHGSPDPVPPTHPLGSPDWQVQLASPPLRLRAAEPDRALAGHPCLTEPELARVWLERALAGPFPGIRLRRCEPSIARYRPGQRCTVICRLTYDHPADPGWPDVVVVKLHRAGEAAAGHAALVALSTAGVDGIGAFTFARPLAFVPEDDASVQGYLPQEHDLVALLEQAASGDEAAVGAAEAALEPVAGALAALHRTELRAGPTEVIDDEIASARATAVKLIKVFPELDDAVEPLLRLVSARARAVAADPAVPSHGAFRPAQVRLGHGRVGLLDLDGFAQSEPAQDVGRFTGKLRLVVVRAADGTVDQPAALAIASRLAGSFRAAYAEHSVVSADRVVLWEVLDLTKALLQTWSRGRPAQLGPILALLEQLVPGLERSV